MRQPASASTRRVYYMHAFVSAKCVCADDLAFIAAPTALSLTPQPRLSMSPV